MNGFKKNCIFVVGIIIIACCTLGCQKPSEVAKETAINRDGKLEDHIPINNIPTNNELDDENIVIKWALPNHINDEGNTERRLNAKLEKDGYPYRLQIVYLDDATYINEVGTCEADVVYTGLPMEEGFYDPAYLDIKKGCYLTLNKYLAGSKLYDAWPQEVWKSVELDGKINCVPNLSFTEVGLMVVIKKDAYDAKKIEAFDGTLEGIVKLIDNEHKLYYGAKNDPFYLDMYDIPNDSIGYYMEEGEIKNLLDFELNIKWLRELNQLYKNNCLIRNNIDPIENANKWTVGMFYSEYNTRFDEEKYYIFNYKGDYRRHFSGSFAIRSNTKKAEAAFEMMQLILTNGEYGNLILFGDSFNNVDGYAVNPESGNYYFAKVKRIYWGTVDGTLLGIEDYHVFPNSEARKKYYVQMVRPIDLTYMKYPEQMDKLLKLSSEYSDIIYNKVNFDKELEEWRIKADEIFKTIEQ
ncbi:MAG: hypothetical protein IJL20_03800 [Lachnospiraceae bacterium]|nr:hypothetical protein [Lachnospiraceae bacterium]